MRLLPFFEAVYTYQTHESHYTLSAEIRTKRIYYGKCSRLAILLLTSDDNKQKNFPKKRSKTEIS